jgi:hypothetical protein
MTSHDTEQCDGGPRIDLDDYFDLRSWAKRYGVTAGEVRRAVAKVGNRAVDVEAWLLREHAVPEASLHD